MLKWHISLLTNKIYYYMCHFHSLINSEMWFYSFSWHLGLTNPHFSVRSSIYIVYRHMVIFCHVFNVYRSLVEKKNTTSLKTVLIHIKENSSLVKPLRFLPILQQRFYEKEPSLATGILITSTRLQNLAVKTNHFTVYMFCKAIPCSGANLKCVNFFLC